jgi:hypothetical protein
MFLFVYNKIYGIQRPLPKTTKQQNWEQFEMWRLETERDLGFGIRCDACHDYRLAAPDKIIIVRLF